MAERRAGTKGRRMGSSRRRQLREGYGETPAPGPNEEPPWASEIVQKVQDFFKEQDKDQTGFVTRSDVQKLQEEGFPCSKEELELVFDGLDAAGTGQLSVEDFTAGLRQFLSSQKAARDHHRRKTASRRVRLVLPNWNPMLEEVDSEERRHFAAFMDQLGTDNISEEQEIWQLWVKLRQDEPQLLGNLEDFLAKMRHRIQEARSKKEALEVTLNRHVAEHDKEVQQLCEALEQQIQQEKQQLQQESVARSHQHSLELQQALDASEREVQRLVTAQMELEMRCRSLRSTQQAASTENRQLEESNRELEDHLQHLHQQLQQTQGRLQTARASVVWEQAEEPRDRVVTELPGEVPLSPQTSPEKSEKYCSKMRIRLGSQSDKPKAKSSHQVVWEMPPAEISLLVAPRRASSAEEDPFPEFLKEERFSDQSSLLREMNDAIVALSKQLKGAPGASPTLADAAHHPRDDAEPQTGPEAATALGTTPGDLRETVPGHMGHQLVEGDLKEGPATAELRGSDVTQAGASVGAGHHRAQELGAEKGQSPEEAQRMLFPQGKGAGVKELVLKVAEHPQGAPGESMEAGEQALMEVEGEGWMQEKAGEPGEAEGVVLGWGEGLEAGLGPPEAGLAAGWQLVKDQLGLAVAPAEHAQPLGKGSLRLSENLEINPGECLEPEPPSPGEARMGAAHGDGVLPEVTAVPAPGMLEEEHVGVEVQPQELTGDAEELPAQAQHGGSSRAEAEEGDVEVPQPQGESVRGEAGRGGSVGPEVLVATNLQEGSMGPDVPPLEAQSSDMQWLPEVEAVLQPPSEASSLGTEQGGSVAPDVEPLDQVDKPELVERVEAEDSQADMELHGGPSLETFQGREDHAAIQLGEEAADEVQGQDEHELPHEPVLDPQGTEVGQGEGAGAGVQPWEEAESLDTLEDQSTDANVPLFAEEDKPKLTPGGGTVTDLQPLSEADDLWTEQGGSVAPDVEPLDQVDKPELVERVEAEDSQADMELCEGPSLETLEGEVDHAATQLMEEAEDEAQGQNEHGLAQEPVTDPQEAGVGQREGAGAEVQPQEETGILETQSTDVNVQLAAEVEELKLTPGGGTVMDLQPLSEADDLWTEQGGSVAPDVEPLDQVDKPELVERVEAEDSQADMELHGGPSLETFQGREDHAATQLGEEAAILEIQSTDANVQRIAEVEELKLTPGWGIETDLQLSSEVSSLNTDQGGSMALNVQEPDQVNKPEFVEMEAEDSPRTDMELHGSAIPEYPQGRGDHTAVQLMEETEDEAQGQDECGLPHEPVLDPHGVTTRQGQGAGTDMQPPEEALILDTVEDQSTDVNVQLIAEVEELKLTPGGGTDADLQPLGEISSLDTEQGGSVAPDVQPLDLVNKLELVAMEAEDSQADMELCEGLSTEASWGGQGRAATQLMEEAEDEGEEQDKHELPHEPVADRQGAGIEQGEGTGADMQPQEEAGILDTLETQSTDANVQLIAEVEELKSASGGGREADLAPLGAAGMWEGEQRQTPGSVAGLCADHPPDAWEGAAGACVSPPAEATSCPEGDAAAAAKNPSLEAKLGVLTGPSGQIPGDTQTLELSQGARAVAEGKALDGAQDLEVMRGERLGTGTRTIVETQDLGLKQGHDDGVSTLASPVSKVPVQTTTLELETVMQKDVLIPDVRRLGPSGQAAQSELQEQVSAQADKVRLHTASQQLEEKPPHVMETEQAAAGPPELPKQEVPPVSTLHQQVQQEGAGNDQLGMVLGDRSLGDAANSSLQLQRKLLGEQSEDLSVGQREKQQEVEQKTSQKGEPSLGEPGAVTADGAGTAPRGSAEASLDPDHLYNVLFIGDSHVGKTTFLYRLHANAFNPHLTATVGLDYQIKNLMVDNKHFALRLWDSAGQERYRSITKQFFRKADGVVLMYDITSEYSFLNTQYWLSCIQEGAEDGVVILLLGNKTDCAAERQVPTEEGERLAKEHQLMFYECSAASGHNVTESMVSLVRLLKVHEDELKIKAKEVPKPPQKKKGCCW